MKTKLFLLVTLLSLFSVKNASSAVPSNWIDPTTGFQYTAALRAQVYKNGVVYEPTGLVLAVFKDGQVRGVKSTFLTSGGKKFFNLTYRDNNTPVSGFNIKVYDPTDDAVYDIVETITFTAQQSIGTTTNPMALNIKLTSVAADQNVSTITDAANADVVVGSAGKITVDANTTLKSVALNGGGKLDLPSGRTLAVTGNFILKSGSRFVDLNPNGGLTVSGITTIQQDLTGAGGATPNGRFWYIGSPVTGATSAVFDAAGANKLWYYNEPTHAYVEITDNTTPLQAGRGYVVRMGANATVSFTGALITGAQSFNLTNTAGNAYSGYNLVYNPYPSFMRWHNAGSLPGAVAPSFWTRSNGAFDSYNVNLGAGSSVGVTRYIAPYQAFWVYSASNVSLPIANDMRTLVDVDNNANSLKAKAVSSIQMLRLKVSNGTEGDEILVAFTPNATNNADGYDTPKMSNDTFKIPEIYTTIGSEKYAINSFNAVSDFALGFETKTANSFTIKATTVSNFDVDAKIVLVDKLNNNFEVELTEGAEYAFTSDVASTNDRFEVKFKSKGTATGVNATTNNLYTLVRNSNNVYELNILNNKTANVKVFNTVGQLIQNFDNVSVKSIGGNLSTGIYTVVVKVDGMQSVSKKLSIK